ncbi:MAG TPA: BCCT family transporter [Clostridiales bacterium]|nr:BCCT family transporter [Clostridiales bacterium]
MKKTWKMADKPILIASISICICFIIWMLIAPDIVRHVFSSILSGFSTSFGWFYLLVVSLFLILMIYFTFSKFGKICLGKDGEKPQYSTFSWFFMLFCAGMGIGLVFWGAAEPLSHYLWPPTGIGRTSNAASEAMRITFFHWGINAWTIYGVFGLPLAYYQFRKGKPALFSSCLEPLISEKGTKGILGKIVDTLTVIATIFGVATSLGMGAMQINSGLYYVFGIPYNNTVTFGIITITTIVFILSSVSGIDKGIKILSNVNMLLMAIILLFIFFAGSTLFLTKFFVDSLGKYLSSIISSCFWTDPFGDSGAWLNNWTIFYWAWWLSWAPFVGGFIARISKGRTIREFILGTILFPSVFCFLFMTIMGGSAIDFDMNGVTVIADALNENIAYTLFALLQQLPLAKLLSLLATILIFIFFITSADSSTFVCAMMTSKGVQNPPSMLKVSWGIFVAAVASLLLYVGGLDALQSVCIAIAFPLLFLCLAILGALLKALKEEI